MIDTAAELKLKRAAKRVYWWLFLLPVVSVPWFLLLAGELTRQSTVTDLIRAAGLPATPYLLVLFLKSTAAKHVFVKRHIQQGLALSIFALLAAFALLLNWNNSQDLIVFFLLFNGGLWFFGRSTGLTQVNKGVGMFVRQSERLSRRSIKKLEGQLNAREDREGSPAEKRDPAPAQTAQQAAAHGEKVLAADRHRKAVEVFLESFRIGDPAVRDLAIRRLEALGELEEF